MTPELLYFGLTQKTAPLAIREQLRADHDAQLALLSCLSEFCVGQIVLATCERFEVYASAQRSAKDGLASLLTRWFDLRAEQFSQYFRTLSGPLVAEHFLRVAAGLDSRIIGERQVLGQVRNAHQTALEQGTLDAQLALLARTAIRTGKRTRHETNLDIGCRSIVTTALDWLEAQHEPISGRNVAVVGSGRLAALVVAQVAQRRPKQIVITGRNRLRAGLLAKHSGAHCADMAELRQTIAQSELVFTCTASPTYLVDAKLIDRNRPKPLRLIDLCVPRNVDPDVASLPGVALAHLDEMIARNLILDRGSRSAPNCNAIVQAEEIVQQELDGFLQWRRERHAVPMIADLLSRAASSSCEVGRRALHEQIMRLKSGVAL